MNNHCWVSQQWHPIQQAAMPSSIALVTGASGFLGRYVVEQLLARGDRVRAYCRADNADIRSLGAEIFLGDITNAEQTIAACAGVDTVYHVAGVAGLWGSWEHFHSINTVGTRSVIDGCRRHGVRRLVYTSTPSVTFDGRDQCGVDESAPYARRWLCHYPHSKALAEQLVLAANGNGLFTCALRPHLIWGPGDRHLVPRLIERQRAGQLRRVGDGRNLIDMVYVENAAAAHLQAADALGPESAACGKAYFISQGEPVNCWRWIGELLALAGLGPVRGSIPTSVAWSIGAGVETVHKTLGLQSEPRMTRFLAAQLGRTHYFNISRARADFGYRPRVSTIDGMKQLGASFSQHQKPSGAE